MIKKMGLMALGLSVILLSGCGSSSDSDVVVNPTPPVVTPDPTAPIEEIAVFTPELLVGRTYTVIDGDERETVSFSEDTISFSGNGDTGTVPYILDADGRLIADGTDIHTLQSMDADGTLHVDNEGTPTTWVLVS